ncbi:preprotein translocase subunit SecE [Salinisphaera hydrothermalis]|uniref:Protein translocase subunit SecE n=1 Tax=Salinisphaera hydrothermalis (strain C41B8) TaxID=1304275 RepID=A0A084IGH9_SALHC|nr:preprotein translocase subunit SecE [Salinisphaera hydrothermalis]KEZ75813.1 protein translocase subunit secE/sec61 gamma [Salinisphaera hydrothermalis C41B8]
MAAQEQRTASALDTALLWLAIVVLIVSIAGYYYFTAYTDVIRVLGMLAGVVVAALIAFQSALGKTAWSYVQGSRTELRRMVWPTRRETMQTTLLVVVFVLILAAFIWALDIVLGYAVTLLTGRA